MRKLPVYLLLDTSGSMNGEPIEALKNGVQVMMSSLRQNPQAIETAWISIITFDNEARQLTPLTDLATFQVPELKAQGATAMGAALDLLARCIDREVTTNSPERKGDWKPLVFIITDGVPTDDWRKGLDELRKRKTGIIVACAAGSRGDTGILKQVTDSVLSLDTADTHSLSRFFSWVSASVGVTSEKIENSGKEVKGWEELPPPPSELNIVV